MSFGIVRIALFSLPLSTDKGTVSKEYIGLFTAFIILVVLWKLLAFCINACNKKKGQTRDEINTKGTLRKLFKNKALRRFLIADCNCHCYKARSRFRFQVHFALLFIFFTLHIVVIELYASAPSGDNDDGTLADIPKPPTNIPSNNSKLFCLKSKEKDNQPRYIGFHTTHLTSANSIAHSDFRPGKNGWFGSGVYFARSVTGTIGKAKSSGGAHIIAEIRMGKVLVVEQKQENFDTCYVIHEHDNRDEFAIKDATTQIMKWVIVIDQAFDRKVEKYELLTESDFTICG
ncbi:unnamed protein product, partial [Rotaria magnacalcarata]